MARTPFKMKSGNSPLFKQMASSPVKQTDYTAMQAKSAKADPRYGKMSPEDYKTEVQRQVTSKRETGSYDAMGAYDHKGKKKTVKPKEKTVKPKEKTVKPEPNGHKGGDVLTKNIVDTSQKGDEAVRPEVATVAEPTNKEVKTKRRVDNIAATAAVKTARAKYGRGSDEVKAAKSAREVLKPGTVASRLLGGKGSKSKAKKDAKNKVKKAKLAEKTKYYNKIREELKQGNNTQSKRNIEDQYNANVRQEMKDLGIN
tara:strand:+ start:76 stop:843 length:768 start_codon:yes stop_codon:yes gene_type:complete